jgi:asparagine synthase (glutamine-hydrolysing)
MSGIVGIVNTNGAPVERELLWRMTTSMSFRGPDAQDVWIDRNVGFGHAMLRTTFAAANERQPATLDGTIWLTADARIDGREELIAKLSTAATQLLPFKNEGEHKASLSLSDAQLILHAYHTWGENCVDHLLGDFALAIWDSRNQQLFCARDHFGVKPFYYVLRGSQFIFGSSPNCLLTHPGISNRLNDYAIADFLLFEMNLEASTSAFADIQRLPPACKLTLSDAGPTLSRYWSLPEEKQLLYKRHQDYIDHFQELMRSAVKDRMRTDSVAMMISGGMDSACVATFARQASMDLKDGALKAFTYVYERLMPDRERYYSGIVAHSLGIPISYTVSDDYKLYQWPKQSGFKPFEIINEPLRALFSDFTQSVGQHSRVALTGDGGDALLYPEDRFPQKVLSSLAFGKVIREAIFCLRSYGKIPRMGFRSGVRKLVSSAPENQDFLVFPGWLNESFENRCHLRDRWEDQKHGPRRTDRLRRGSYESMSSVMWPHLFADYDPETTGSAVEVRYPFFDIRVVNFLLSVPSLPWCFNKGLLRFATQRQLPAEIRKRLKTQIVQDPILVRVRQTDWALNDYFTPVEGFSNYVNASRVNKEDWLTQQNQIWMHARPLSFNYWLRSL